MLGGCFKKLIELNLIKPKTKIGLLKILNLLTKWRNDLLKKDHRKLMQIVLDESGYSAMLKNKKDLENENRLENIKELLNAMREFDNLESFLEHVALATAIDRDWEGKKINLMTIHASKGLEFDVVFLPGWEEGLFPHQKSLDEKGKAGLEEERRLAYVGITRAKENLFLSCSRRRRFQGVYGNAIKSRFLGEIPKHVLKSELKKKMKQNFHWKSNLETKNNLKTKSNYSSYVLDETIDNIKLDFSDGDKITHKHFGEGTLISHRILSSDIELSIKFKSPYGLKKIMKNRAPISITSFSQNLNPEDYYGI